MERNLLKEEIKEIEMPLEMKERILKNCRNAQLDKKESVDMKNTDKTNRETINTCENNTTGKKPHNSRRKWSGIATVAAAVALCLGLGSVTALAATGKLEGFFADVTRWDGAVVGTTYEQATEEIEVTAYAEEDILVVEAVLLKANEAPYFVIENWGIGKYSIQDADGKVVAEGSTAALFEATDGKIKMEISMEEPEAGSYTLIITEFTGSSKADQDLPVKGYWECEFSF